MEILQSHVGDSDYLSITRRDILVTMVTLTSTITRINCSRLLTIFSCFSLTDLRQTSPKSIVGGPTRKNQ